jgi:predicted metal-dependent hydrolase
MLAVGDGSTSASTSIAARDIKFELSDRIPSHWCPDQPEFSHVASAFMAALPQLEPYFIHNIREAARSIDDAQLKAEIEGFVAQEARHAQQHRRWNEVLGRRYPELLVLERKIKERLDKSKRGHSLAFRMAYTAGYEAITYQLVGFMMDERARWLTGADPDVLGLLCWHGAEEVEHKTVAYDAFQAVHGGWTMRARGLIAALIMTVKDIRDMAQMMIKADGLWDDAQARRRLRKVRIAFAVGLLPRFRHYLMPAYDPAKHHDPDVMLKWLARYAAGEDLRKLPADALDRW